jgi:hypothetical protein
LADTARPVEYVNATAIDALCAGAGRHGAILWVAPREAARAAGTLGAA